MGGQVIRDHLLDATKASPLAVYGATSWFMNVDWGTIGAFLMALYALLLCLDKLGLLGPLKAAVGRLFRHGRPDA